MEKIATTERLRAVMAARRAFSPAEIVADGIVHGVGLVAALIAGSVLITLTALLAGPAQVAQLAVYIGTLVLLLTVSLAYNLAPIGSLKAWLARLDQAAIFLFIAGTYTPLLAAASGSMLAEVLLIVVWAAAIVGVTLKLWVPHRFGRIAILLYLAIGWSGLVAFEVLSQSLPPEALWLIVAGGLSYTAGIGFHLWEAMRFQTVVWHGFVVLGAGLHLAAVFRTLLPGPLAL